MYKRISITLPESLGVLVENEVKQTHFKSRSELVVKAIKHFFGLDMAINKEALKKYGHIYESLQNEDKLIAKDMMSVAANSLPEK
jgi:metal-responsive CopG/Arc/MetJ family transcriptional regulator